MSSTDGLIERLVGDMPEDRFGHTLAFAWPLLAILLLAMIGIALALDGAFASVVEHGWGPLTVKWGFSLALLAFSAFALFVLGKPGRRARWALIGVALPFLPIVGLLIFELAISDAIIFRPSWQTCLAAMTAISPIAFVAAVFAMRAMAPTRLRMAGAVAGLFGGAVAMTAYAPFCPEIGMVYMAVFYVGPMIVMLAVGWALGPRLMRW